MREQTLYKAFHSFFFYVNGTHEHDVGSNWGALWARLSVKASEDPLRWLYFKFVWQVQLCEFVSLPLAFTTDGINFYFSRQSVAPYRDSFDSRWVHLAPDPAGKVVDVGIESSRWTCSRWRTRQVCSSVRSRRPSSPHRWCSDFCLSRTPGVHLSHPAETQAYKRYSETCNFVHSKHTPDRSQCPPAELLLRTCCCPAHPHRHEELCSVCPRWGKHKHSAGGCCISLKHEEKDINDIPSSYKICLVLKLYCGRRKKKELWVSVVTYPEITHSFPSWEHSVWQTHCSHKAGFLGTVRAVCDFELH